MTAANEITLLALGPLTNLALAVSLEPSIARNVREVIIMGGVVSLPGNSSPVAESNIYNDPEAAKIVFNAGWPLIMVGLDVTRQVIMTPEYLSQFGNIGTPQTNLISKIIPFYLNYYRQYQDIEGIYVHDSTAVAYALHPEWFQTQIVFVDVVTGDSLESGQTAADLRGQWEREPNISVCSKVNASAILDLYIDRVSSAKKDFVIKPK
jgi:inosine-uridine nucleoside N-ribohydrolase